MDASTRAAATKGKYMATEPLLGATSTTFALTHQRNDASLSAVMLDDEKPLDFHVELSGTEKEMLKNCEEIITRGFTHFMQVGEALATIRKGRLYKEQYLSFEEYCQDKWGFGRYRALQYMQAAETGQNLVTKNHSVAGLNVHQLRLLRPLDPDSQVDVMTRARNLAGTKKLKTSHILEAIEIVNRRGNPATDDNAEEQAGDQSITTICSIIPAVQMPIVTMDMLTDCFEEIDELLEAVENSQGIRSAVAKLRKMVITFATQASTAPEQEAA